MGRVPQFSSGVFSEKWWRQHGDIDDCAPCADMLCVHGVAPWEPLPGITAYRAAAGNPDDPTKGDGLDQNQSMRALKTLYPKLKVEKITGGAWSPFLAKIKSFRPASVSVFSAALATKNGKPVRHRGALYWNGSILRFVNPLRDPHSVGTEISEAAIRKAMSDYPEPGEVNALVFPTVEEAFTTHPLYLPVVPPVAKKLTPGLYEV